MDNHIYDKIYDRVYTIGCFDYFHYGHEKLFQYMREKGKKVIVGIHDDTSIEKLKNLGLNDHQNLETRMKNIKPYVDVIYVIPSTDPTFYIDCIIQKEDNHNTACFIRANDMPQFPSRQLVEKKMDIILIEYTNGISSTQIRNNKNILSDIL